MSVAKILRPIKVSEPVLGRPVSFVDKINNGEELTVGSGAGYQTQVSKDGGLAWLVLNADVWQL